MVLVKYSFIFSRIFIYKWMDYYSCNNGFDYCQFSFGSSMEKAFKEEISVFYVAITRAKKNVFLTVNTGLNQWGYAKQKSCLVELQGLSLVDYTWEDIIL